jgi:tetratricopeptide (TPR) repeat protein
LLLAVAAVIAIAALNSGGNDNQKAASTAKQPSAKKKSKAKQQTTPQQAAQQPQQTQGTQPSGTTPAAPTGGGANPAEGARLDAQGFRLIQQGQYAQAVPIEQRAVASFPDGDTSANHAYALFNLGTALNRSGRSKEAIPYLEKRLSFSSDRREVVQAELDRARRSAGSG